MFLSGFLFGQGFCSRLEGSFVHFPYASPGFFFHTSRFEQIVGIYRERSGYAADGEAVLQSPQLRAMGVNPDWDHI